MTKNNLFKKAVQDIKCFLWGRCKNCTYVSADIPKLKIHLPFHLLVTQEENNKREKTVTPS